MAAHKSTQSPIRTAVLGYGLAGRVFHCPFISAVPGLELTTILQRRGTEAQDAYPSAHIARSVEEVLSDPAIDLVVVGTPNDTHFDLAKRTLQAGKHCVVDKPFAATSAEAAELVQLSERTGKLVIPFHNRRLDGDFLTLRDLISAGPLGSIVEISSRFDRFRPAPKQNSWKEKPGSMSGLLFDLGSHLLDQALALFGAPEAVTAAIYRDREGTEIDDAFEVVLSYGNGRMRYRCGSSLMAAEPSPRFRVNGTEGSFVKYGVDPQEATVGAGTRPPAMGTDEVWLAESEEAWGKVTLSDPDDSRAPLRTELHRTHAGDYRLFYENVRDAINGTAEPLIGPEDGYRCIRMLEYAVQSSHEQRTIRVEL